MSEEKPDEAIATLADFTRCLQPDRAIVDRQALEEVLDYLAQINSQHHCQSQAQMTFIAGPCRWCGRRS